MRRVRKFRWLPVKDGAVLVTLLALAMVLGIALGNARPRVASAGEAVPATHSALVEACSAVTPAA